MLKGKLMCTTNYSVCSSSNVKAVKQFIPCRAWSGTCDQEPRKWVRYYTVYCVNKFHRDCELVIKKWWKLPYWAVDWWALRLLVRVWKMLIYSACDACIVAPRHVDYDCLTFNSVLKCSAWSLTPCSWLIFRNQRKHSWNCEPDVAWINGLPCLP